MKLNILAATTAIALGTLGVDMTAQAMHIHVNGHQIVLSGGTTATDGYLFANTLLQLQAQGRLQGIDTVVLRNAPGGAMFAGYANADLIRRMGLTTVVSGYCISACSSMFSGGLHRAFADRDQPFMLDENLGDFPGQFIGLHGVTVNGSDYGAAQSQTWRQFFIKALHDGNTGALDDPLFKDALSNHGAAYARVWDPAAGRQPSVYWCNPDCKNPAQYKAYPGDDAYRAGLITEHSPRATTDTLVVDHDVSGNINPNYFNMDVPGAIDPLTPLGHLSARYTFSDYNDPNYSALSAWGSQDDIYLDSYNNNPSYRSGTLQGLRDAVLQDYRSGSDPATFRALLADPNSLLNKDLSIVAAGGPLVDNRAISLSDAYGILHVTSGASWTLHQGEHGAADVLMVDRGSLRLDGGVLNIPTSFVGFGGLVEGHGGIGQLYSGNPDAPTLWFRDGAVLHPTGEGIELAGYVPPTKYDNASTSLVDIGDAALALDVHASQRQGSLRFESVIVPVVPHGYTGRYNYWYGGHLNVSSQSVLALNITPGFYAPSQVLPLVTPDIGTWLAWLQRTAPADFQSLSAATLESYRKTLVKQGGYVTGIFTHLMRADANGNPAGDYQVDPTTGAAFHPFDDSLISYGLVQNASGLWLQPNDAFKDQSAFCGRDGCGLGDALSVASARPDTPLAPLLGALQFSTVAQASHAAGQIRGEGYAALRTASLGLLGDFSGTLDQHVRAVSSGSDDGATAAFMNGAAGMGLDGTRRGTDVASMMRYLVAPDEVAGGSNTGHTNVWGRLFGSKGRLDAQGDAAGLRERTTGVMLGVDVPLKDNVVIGGSLGYGKLRANDSGSAFQSRVRALDARFYADYRYDGGYLDASLGVTRLRQTANRGIDLPLYAARGSSRDAGNAWSLHLEHGLTLRDRHDIVWQPILPSLDMVRLPENRFSDKGLGAAGLDVRAKSTTDTRLGVGVQVYKVFAWGDQGTWTPHARVLLQHRFNRHENEFMANLQGYPEGVFQVTGPNEGLNHAVVNLGLSARRGQHVAFTVDYVGDYAKRHRDQGVMLGASYRW